MKKQKKDFASTVTIIIGIVFITIPVIGRANVTYKQKHMINYVNQQIQQEKMQLELRLEDAARLLNKKYQLIDSKLEQQLELLQLEEAEQKEVKNTTIQDVLANQTIIGIIDIKKLGISYPIVEGTGKENIKAAIGHMKNTTSFGKEGNCVLAGHRGGMYGSFFLNIHKLEIGDIIQLTDIKGIQYDYQVYESFIVEPSDMSVVKDEKIGKILTLITCEDNGMTRFIVRGKLVGK